MENQQSNQFLIKVDVPGELDPFYQIILIFKY